MSKCFCKYYSEIDIPFEQFFIFQLKVNYTTYIVSVYICTKKNKDSNFWKKTRSSNLTQVSSRELPKCQGDMVLKCFFHNKFLSKNFYKLYWRFWVLGNRVFEIQEAGESP